MELKWRPQPYNKFAADNFENISTRLCYIFIREQSLLLSQHYQKSSAAEASESVYMREGFNTMIPWCWIAFAFICLTCTSCLGRDQTPPYLYFLIVAKGEIALNDQFFLLPQFYPRYSIIILSFIKIFHIFVLMLSKVICCRSVVCGKALKSSDQ